MDSENYSRGRKCLVSIYGISYDSTRRNKIVEFPGCFVGETGPRGDLVMTKRKINEDRKVARRDLLLTNKRVDWRLRNSKRKFSGR